MVKNMVKEYIHMQIKIFILDGLLLEKSKEKEPMFLQKQDKEY